MQCCGEPFAVSSRVEWTVLPVADAAWFAEILGPELAAGITDHEEHHSDRLDLVTMRGVVRSIDAVFCRYRVRAKAAVAIEGSGVLVPRQAANGWEDDDERGDGLSFVGYLVALDTSGR